MDITYVHTFHCIINTHTVSGLPYFQRVQAFAVVKTCAHTRTKGHAVVTSSTHLQTLSPSHVYRKTHTVHIYKYKSCLLNIVYPDAHTLTHRLTTLSCLSQETPYPCRKHYVSQLKPSPEPLPKQPLVCMTHRHAVSLSPRFYLYLCDKIIIK